MLFLANGYVPLRNVCSELATTVLAEHAVVYGSILHLGAIFSSFDGSSESSLLEAPLVVQFTSGDRQLDEAGSKCLINASHSLYLLFEFLVVG